MSALFNSGAVIALLHVKSKGMQCGTDEAAAFPAMLLRLCLTTGFHRAAVPPKGFIYIDTALTAHGFPETALAAQ